MNRLTAALGLALTALFGITGTAFATPEQPDREEVAIGMLLVALGFMFFLLLVYGVKWYFGLDEEMPPPQADDSHH